MNYKCKFVLSRSSVIIYTINIFACFCSGLTSLKEMYGWLKISE